MSSTHPRRSETVSPTDPDPSDGEAIRQEIERLRDDLGETIGALSEKADVKAQASAKADALKQRAQDARAEAKRRVDEVRTRVTSRPRPVIAGAIALVIVVWIVRTRPRRRRG